MLILSQIDDVLLKNSVPEIYRCLTINDLMANEKTMF